MKKILSSKYSWLYLLIALIGINYIASELHFRLDLTKEKRFTLSNSTKSLIRNLPGKVEITVFLEGDMPSGFKKLAGSTKELLQEFKEHGKNNIQFSFTKPGEGLDDTAKMIFLDSIARMGIKPYTVQVRAKENEGSDERQVVPGALISYDGRATAINLLSGQQSAVLNESVINNTEALLEYKFASSIQKLTTDTVPLVGYLLGNGETYSPNVKSLIYGTLRANYRFSILPIDSVPLIPPFFDVLFIMKPTQPFNERQKLKLDQYVMNGGKIVWMIDRLYAEMDSLMRKQSDFIAYDRNLNIEDLLFKYGVRINPDLVQDLVCDKIPLVVGSIGDQPQMELVDWPYFPLLSSASENSITKGLNQVLSIFPNSIDTIKVPNITKTILLETSANARKLVTPALVSLNSVKTEDDLKTFDKAHIPIAVLLEGKFSSLYSNRLPKSTLDSFADVYQQPFLSSALIPGKMIVVADADIATNVYAPQGEGDLEMGYNKFTQAQYANKDFILNCIEYLTNSSGILATRSKEYTLRLLDAKKIESDKNFWQLINIGLPIILVLLFGFLFQALRKRKYQIVKRES